MYVGPAAKIKQLIERKKKKKKKHINTFGNEVMDSEAAVPAIRIGAGVVVSGELNFPARE